MKQNLSEKDVYAGNLILVNEDHAYNQEEHCKLIPLKDEEIILKDLAVKSLNVLMDSINGWQSIQAVSGWRSFKEQEELYQQSIIENGIEFTEQFVALPGHSEHQTGLAIDLGIKQEEIDFIRPDFPYDGICQIFREKAILYGFVERYAKSKEHITKIAHEPWHFRFVGFPHAQIMSEKNMVLEEYIQFIENYEFNKNEYLFSFGNIKGTVSYIELCQEELVIEVEDTLYTSISGDNRRGFIITKWEYL